LKHVLAALITLAGFTGVAAAQDQAGTATPINADHLSIQGIQIALYGIDAPEPDQAENCFAGRRSFGCYDNALRQLQILTSMGPLECMDVGKTDVLGAPYMICTVGGEDVGEAMVLAGVAFAFRQQTDKYVEAEEAAKAGRMGLWQPGLRYDMPWDWRVMMGRPIGP
jgi:endonuclease YncB( thermonuclease family)